MGWPARQEAKMEMALKNSYMVSSLSCRDSDGAERLIGKPHTLDSLTHVGLRPSIIAIQ